MKRPPCRTSWTPPGCPRAPSTTTLPPRRTSSCASASAWARRTPPPCSACWTRPVSTARRSSRRSSAPPCKRERQAQMLRMIPYPGRQPALSGHPRARDLRIGRSGLHRPHPRRRRARRLPARRAPAPDGRGPHGAQRHVDQPALAPRCARGSASSAAERSSPSPPRWVWTFSTRRWWNACVDYARWRAQASGETN